MACEASLEPKCMSVRSCRVQGFTSTPTSRTAGQLETVLSNLVGFWYMLKVLGRSRCYQNMAKGSVLNEFMPLQCNAWSNGFWGPLYTITTV